MIKIKKHLTPLLLLVISLYFLTSCSSSKDLVYLSNMADGQKAERLLEKGTRHLIVPGDILYISVKSINPEVNAAFDPETAGKVSSGNTYQKYLTPSGAYLYGFEVNADGNVTVPILGKIRVVGHDQQEVEFIVQQKADEYIKDAIVKVKLLNFKVTVLGEVFRPGVYYNYNNTFTVLEAIAMANGNTDYANIKKILVVRPGLESNQSYMLDLSSKDTYLSEAFYLQPNDYVFVQPDKRKDLQLNGQAYSMILSSLSVLITVLTFALR